MPANRPEIFNPDELLNWYDLQGDDFAAWRVYAGEKPHPHYCRAEYYGSEKMQGREELQAAAQAIQQNPNNTNRYCLEVFTDDVLAAEKKRGAKKASNKLPIKTIVFQFNGGEQFKPLGAVAGFGGSDPALVAILKQQAETNNLILSKMAAIEAQLSENEDEDEDDEPKDAIGSLLTNPQIQQMAINLLAGMFTPKQPGQPAAVAGIPDDTQLQNAIDILKKNDPDISDHLYKLAQLSEKNPAFFQTLIGMLNGMAV